MTDQRKNANGHHRSRIPRIIERIDDLEDDVSTLQDDIRGDLHTIKSDLRSVSEKLDRHHDDIDDLDEDLDDIADKARQNRSWIDQNKKIMAILAMIVTAAAIAVITGVDISAVL